MQRKLSDHRSPITSVDAPLTNDSICASGGYDGRVILWNRSGEADWGFQAPDLINHVKFDHGVRRIAAACANGNVYILSCESGECIRIIGPHKDDVNASAWLPENRLLVTVADAADLDIHAWDPDTGEHVQAISGHEHGVFAVSVDPTGTRLATAAEDGTARIWSMEGGLLHVLKHPGDPETVDWSPDGRYVATGCDDKILRIWDAQTGELLATSDAASSKVSVVKFSPCNSELLAGSYDGCLRLYDVADFSKVKKVFAKSFQWERSATFMAGGIVIGSFDSAPIRHMDDGAQAPPSCRTYGINTIACPAALAPNRPQDDFILVGRDDGSVFEVVSQTKLHVHDSIVNTVTFSPDDRLVASGDYLGVIRIWDLKDQHLIAEKKVSGGPVNSIAWLSGENGVALASAGYDGVIRWWSGELELKGETKAHGGPIKSITWNGKADVLIAGSSDDSISAWRAGELLYHHDPDELVLVNAVATFRDLEVFVSASRDGIIRIWQVTNGNLVDELPFAHKKSVKAIAIAPTGDRIISGSYDGNAISWVRESGRWSWTELVLHGKPGVPGVAFMNTDQSLLTAGWDGSVGRWSPDGKLLHKYALGSSKAGTDRCTTL
ncbi:MAG: hypothetical protein HC888_03180 [Candidatus Competibacteraceae bacterium]|nr:hypothetical protein [Candidatus Competibacteraceae bacterium]